LRLQYQSDNQKRLVSGDIQYDQHSSKTFWGQPKVSCDRGQPSKSLSLPDPPSLAVVLQHSATRAGNFFSVRLKALQNSGVVWNVVVAKAVNVTHARGPLLRRSVKGDAPRKHNGRRSALGENRSNIPSQQQRGNKGGTT
jgi:hypothetical protein